MKGKQMSDLDFGTKSSLRDLADLLSTAARNEVELYWLHKQYAELEKKYNDLLDSSVKQAQESSGLLLASVVAGIKLEKGPIEVVPVTFCSRVPLHVGPCNGFPTKDCPRPADV